MFSLLFPVAALPFLLFPKSVNPEVPPPLLVSAAMGSSGSVLELAGIGSSFPPHTSPSKVFLPATKTLPCNARTNIKNWDV